MRWVVVKFSDNAALSFLCNASSPVDLNRPKAIGSPSGFDPAAPPRSFVAQMVVIITVDK